MRQPQEPDWTQIGKNITRRLQIRYSWIETDELMGCAMLGAAMADAAYKPGRGASRTTWATLKGYYNAIDELRRHHGVIRPHEPSPPVILQGSAMSMEDRNKDPMLFAAHECLGVPQEQYVGTSCEEWLRGLTDKQRQVLRLRHDEGLSPPEIADRMGIKLAAVFWCQRKALDNLRVWRQREYEAGERTGPT